MEERDKVIVRTSFIGIAANVLLAAFKAFVGLLSGSIAVILDAINNLSDAVSSLVTIIGTKLSRKQPDRKHPLGYGRIEYLSAMIVAAIVLYAGVTSCGESIKKIIHPESADYSLFSIIIIGVAVLVKLLLGLYVMKKGKEVKSASLVASGTDALTDAIVSLSVLVSALVYVLFSISIEAYIGLLISLIIIKAGCQMLAETISELIGKRADCDLVLAIKKMIVEDEDVSGAYDLILHNYGPDSYTGSVHIEISDKLGALDIERVTRRIQAKVYNELGVILEAVSIYAVNNVDEEIVKARNIASKIALAHEGIKQTHGFYLDTVNKVLTIDCVISFDVKDMDAVFSEIHKEISAEFPDYLVKVNRDYDISD